MRYARRVNGSGNNGRSVQRKRIYYYMKAMMPLIAMSGGWRATAVLKTFRDTSVMVVRGACWNSVGNSKDGRAPRGAAKEEVLV